MQFRKQQAIYLQIGEHLCDSIVNGQWAAGQKIPSVREMAVRVEVNPNTVMRTYTDLEQKGILYNRRGIGFFVGDDAVEKILDIKRDGFIRNDVPNLFKTMKLLGMKMKDLQQLFARFTEEHAEEEGDEG